MSGPRWENCTGGAARLVDEAIFSIRNIYQYPTCREIYKTGFYFFE